MHTFTLFNNEPDIVLVPPGGIIFAQGDRGDAMYAVISGEVHIVRGTVVLESVREGGVFGEMALLDNEPRSATALAKTGSRVARIPAARFLALVSTNPHFALEMMRLLAERVRRNLAS